MSRSRMLELLFVIVLLGMALVACQSPVIQPSQTVVDTDAQPSDAAMTPSVAPTAEVVAEPAKDTAADETLVVEPVTLNVNLGGEPDSLDPARAAYPPSVDVVENLFEGLTRVGPNGSIEPALASDWTAADDGLTYTFNLRDDAVWVRYVADGGVQKIAPVTADDVAYGIRRACDPRTASPLVYMNYGITGCRELNTAETRKMSPQEIQSLVDSVGVTTPDSATVQINLNSPNVAFPAIAAVWINRPVYRAAVEEGGEHWAEPAHIVTNGPFALAGWSLLDDIVLVKNPLWTGWNRSSGNIERIELRMTAVETLALGMYKAGDLDTVNVPQSEIAQVKNDPALGIEFVQFPDTCMAMVGFSNSKAPLDNALVRRALSAAIDRQQLIDVVLENGSTPANAAAPGMIFGSPAGNPEIAPWALPESMGGWGHDSALAQAKEWLAQGGYPDGKDMPELTLMYTSATTSRKLAEAVQSMWTEGLGIQVRLQPTDYNTLVMTNQASTLPRLRPHAWIGGWCADYGDENNWVYDLFNSAEGINDVDWEADASAPLGPEGKSFNELTKEAQQTADPAQRQALYRAAEQILVDDAAAVAPLFYDVRNELTKPYLQRSFSDIGGDPWYTWALDQDAKRAAQGR